MLLCERKNDEVKYTITDKEEKVTVPLFKFLKNCRKKRLRQNYDLHKRPIPIKKRK